MGRSKGEEEDRQVLPAVPHAERGKRAPALHHFGLVCATIPSLNAGTLARPVSPHIVILMGVAGSGKTTIGRMVADALGWSFFEADDFHSAANKAKMERSLPLDDADRAPWLASVRAKIDECRAAGRKAIFTCSALKAQYRSRLGTDVPDTLLVHLTGDIRTIETRVARRAGHFMKAEMVRSQFDVLEPPAEALTIDVAWPPAEIVQTILRRINSA